MALAAEMITLRLFARVDGPWYLIGGPVEVPSGTAMQVVVRRPWTAAVIEQDGTASAVSVPAHGRFTAVAGEQLDVPWTPPADTQILPGSESGLDADGHPYVAGPGLDISVVGGKQAARTIVATIVVVGSALLALRGLNRE